MSAMKYFTINDMVRSAKAKQYHIDNIPNKEQEKFILAFIRKILDPLQDSFDKPIKIENGFMCKNLYALIGSDDDDHHLCEDGYAAADLNTHTKKGNRRLFELAQGLDLPFCQLINHKNASCIHISYNYKDIRKEVLYT